MTDYLTTQQAADILGVDSSAVRRLCIVGMAACALATSATDTDGARAVDMVS